MTDLDQSSNTAPGDDAASQDGTDQSTPWVMREPAERAPGEEATNPVNLVLFLGLFGLIWYFAGFRSFLFVIGLVVMIFLHELGHFMTARWTGMKATQFFIGFGPRIWSFRRGEVEYGLRAIPAGAFVRILGMNNLDPIEDPADQPRAYMHKSYPRRMLVITAGSLMHFIQALLLFIFAFSVVGEIDPDSSWDIATISGAELLEQPDSPDGEATITREVPAQEAGLNPGDTIVAADGIDATRFADLRTYLRDRPGEPVTFSVVRADGSTEEVTATLAAIPSGEAGDEEGMVGFLGIAPSFDGRDRLSPVVGVEAFGSAMKAGVTTIPRFFTPANFANLGSLLFEGRQNVEIESDEANERPISMVGAVRIAGQEDFDPLVPITFLAFINVFVGLVNLVPLLPLDGGHAAIATYERIRSQFTKAPYHADVAKLLPMTYGVVMLLAFLFISTVWLDIFRPIG